MPSLPGGLCQSNGSNAAGSEAFAACKCCAGLVAVPARATPPLVLCATQPRAATASPRAQEVFNRHAAIMPRCRAAASAPAATRARTLVLASRKADLDNCNLPGCARKEVTRITNAARTRYGPCCPPSRQHRRRARQRAHAAAANPGFVWIPKFSVVWSRAMLSELLTGSAFPGLYAAQHNCGLALAGCGSVHLLRLDWPAGNSDIKMARGESH